jgi:hypothetical protein
MKPLVKWDGRDAIVVEHVCLGGDRVIGRLAPVTITKAAPLTIIEVVCCAACGIVGNVIEGEFVDRSTVAAVYLDPESAASA